MLRVCRAISRSSDVKVLLTGDGGDDVFLGYPRHRHFCIAGKLAERLPRAAMQLWESTASCVPRVGPLRRAAALMEYATGGLEGVIDYSRRLQRYEVDYLIGERLRHCCLEEDTRLSRGSGQTLLTDFLEYEFNTRFVGEYMTKVDGATMHYGIEARSPFLDHCMWEFASSLPFAIRLHRGRLKAVLRQLVREEIGRTVAKRPKRGFGIPVQRWVVRRWRPWVEQLLQDSMLEADGWIRSGLPLRRLTAAAERGMAPIHLWYIVVLESWVRHERRLRA
jgi:asparagine synthase (glutamine-hydrolysing)